MKLSTTTSGYELIAANGGSIDFSNLNFGASAWSHIRAESNGSISASGNYSISGGVGIFHFDTVTGGNIYTEGRTATLTGTPNFAVAFAGVNIGGTLHVNGMTFSGSGTGPRYSASANGVIFTNGGGANYFPGNSAGSTATGGQYI